MPNIHTLKSGLTLITDYIDTVETVSVGMWNKVGARNEHEDVNGVAHLLEHMAFKGTHNRSALDIAKEVEMVGGAVNAYTSREVTAYYMKVLKEDIGLSIDIISDILQNSAFDSKELDRERGVVLQEIGMYLDTPDDVVFDKWQEMAFPNQPMGRSILGKSETIKTISRDQVEGFMKGYYRPDKMVFSVSGNFEEKNVIELIEKYFQNLPNSDSGIFGVYAGTGQKEIMELIPVLWDQLNISAKDFSEEELQRARAQFKSSLLMGQESTSRRCRSNASKFLMHNRIIPHEEIIAEIDQVQLEDLEKARLNILKSNITLSSIGPIKNLESLDSIKRRLS